MAFSSGREAKLLQLSRRMGEVQLRKLVSELLREEEQSKALIDSLPIGIILLDTEFSMRSLNRAANRCLLLEKRVCQTRSKSYPIWYGLANEELAGWLERELQSESPTERREFRVYDNRNQEYIYQIEVSSLVRGGLIEGWILLIDNISELRAKERKWQQAEMLESLSALTAGVAHEIKNPLAAMNLYVQLIRKMLGQEDPDRLKTYDELLEYSQIVLDEIDRLNAFVTDFLLTVRPLELDRSPNSLNQLLENALELIKVELETQQIHLEVFLGDSLPPVGLDEPVFKRLLLNLSQNAIQAVEERRKKADGDFIGKISIKTSFDEDFVYLEIQDNGCGMSEEVQKKIFEPFFTTKNRGSGLGMTMVLRILQTYGGDLQFQSGENTGTRITVKLPHFDKKIKIFLTDQFSAV